MGSSAARIGRWRNRLGGLLRVRWLLAAGVGLLGGLVTSRQPETAARLFALALGGSIVNLALSLWQHHWPLQRARTLRGMALAQWSLDLLLLSLLVRWTGGWASPFLSLGVPLAVAAGLLSQGLRSALLAGSGLLIPLLVGIPGGEPLLVLQGRPWIHAAVGLLAAALTVRLCLVEGPRRRRRLRVERSQRRRRSVRAAVEEMAVELATQVRDPLATVRARAERLRLSLLQDDRAVDPRDLDLLLEGLDGIQRALRGVLAYLPPRRVGGRVELLPLLREEWADRGEDPRRLQLEGPAIVVEGSHDELALALASMMGLAAEYGCPDSAVRVLLREDASAGMGAVEVRFAPLDVERWRGRPRGGPGEAGDAGRFRTLTVLDRVARNHGGRARVEQASGEVRLRLELRSSRGRSLRLPGARSAVSPE